MSRRLMAGIVFVACVQIPWSGTHAQSASELAPEVHAIFEHYCSGCHQADPGFPDRKTFRFDYILDLDRLAADYVVAGSPDQSYLFHLIDSDHMPPMAYLGFTPALTDAEKATVAGWIKSLSH